MENNIFNYLLQVSILFSLLFLLYKVLVSNLTFHSSNRWILLSLPIISLTLPFIDIGFLLPFESSQINMVSIELQYFYEDMGESVNDIGIQGEQNNVSNYTLKFWSIFYLLGVIGALVRFIKTTKQVYSIKRNSRKLDIDDTEVFLAKIQTPFSYFKWIFIPEKQGISIHRLILEHEATHVRKMHGLDLLLTECYAIMFWFNPIIYWYRRSIKALHEFQADQGVLAKNTKPSEYLELMLNAIQYKNNQNSLSYFNNPIIKKRIDMITKIQSKKRYTFRYILLLLGVLLISAAFTIPKNTKSNLLPVLQDKVIIEVQPPSIFPLKEYNPDDIARQYGQKGRHPKSKKIVIHQGIDIRAIEGTPVIATAHGVVANASLENEWGNLIVVAHPDGYQTWYAHLDGFNVEENQSVKKGQIIGYVGNTGLSSEPHLHYEVRKGDEILDPKAFFQF